MKFATEEQIVLFLDFLGFSEASVRVNEPLQSGLLSVLQRIAALRSDFQFQSRDNMDGSTSHTILPTISTFSDHIVASYPLQRIDLGGEHAVHFVVLNQLHNIVSLVASDALRLGLLVRGGVTVGKLYHAGGVVFGEAMVEAYQIEARTSVYPRVVLSDKLAKRIAIVRSPHVRQDFDGLPSIDYFLSMLLRSAQPGGTYMSGIASWYSQAVSTMRTTIERLEREEKLNERAKWTWFAKLSSKRSNEMPMSCRRSAFR